MAVDNTLLSLAVDDEERKRLQQMNDPVQGINATDTSADTTDYANLTTVATDVSNEVATAPVETTVLTNLDKPQDDPAYVSTAAASGTAASEAAQNDSNSSAAGTAGAGSAQKEAADTASGTAGAKAAEKTSRDGSTWGLSSLPTVYSVANKKPAPAPTVKPVVPMPDPIAQEAARRQAVVQAIAGRHGRASTVLTRRGKLGG